MKVSNFWNIEGVPHKGWALISVIDVREGGLSVDDTDYETCMMCGNERIRYVHILEHDEYDGEFRVGCVCAEKMTDDYVNPRRMETDLRNRAVRKSKWLSKNWRVSKHGNFFLNKDDHNLVIYRDKNTKKYKCKIDEIWGHKAFDTLYQAKMAMFDGIEYLKERGDW